MDIEVISKELLKGSTMLKEHCNTCGCPLFKDTDGNIYCPNCLNSRSENTIINNNFKSKEGKNINNINNINNEDSIYKNNYNKTNKNKDNNYKTYNNNIENIVNTVENVSIKNTNHILVESINKKLIYLSDKLNNEVELKRIMEIAQCIEYLITIRNKLK